VIHGRGLAFQGHDREREVLFREGAGVRREWEQRGKSLVSVLPGGDSDGQLFEKGRFVGAAIGPASLGGGPAASSSSVLRGEFLSFPNTVGGDGVHWSTTVQHQDFTPPVEPLPYGPFVDGCHAGQGTDTQHTQQDVSLSVER